MLKTEQFSDIIYPMIENDEWNVIQESPIFDKTKIENLSEAITAIKAKEFAENYMNTLSEQLALIVNGIERSDFYVVEFNAHKLSSGAGTFGHSYLHYLLLYIEKHAVKKKIVAPFNKPDGVQLLKDKSEQSIQEMKKYLEKI